MNDPAGGPTEQVDRPTVDAPDGQRPGAPHHDQQPARGATAAQLRRFIKSRAYVPLHELRRRFELNGLADDVSPIRTPDGIVFAGLPARECQLLAELVRCGDVGLELCRDPSVAIVMGVYPMRPVIRS